MSMDRHRGHEIPSEWRIVPGQPKIKVDGVVFVIDNFAIQGKGRVHLMCHTVPDGIPNTHAFCLPYSKVEQLFLLHRLTHQYTTYERLG